MKRYGSKNKGSISIEAALTMPTVLLLVLMLVSGIQCIRSETVLYGCFDRQTSLHSSMITILGSKYEEVKMGLLEESLKAEVKKEYRSIASSRIGNRKYLEILSIYLELPLTGKALKAVCEYELIPSFLKTKRNFVTYLPRWYTVKSDSAKTVTMNNNIWEKDNFERGRLIGIRFGANLPIGYPVIDGFYEGTALSIRSMDLTKKTWQDTEAARREIEIELEELASFSGTSSPWGSDEIHITNEDIYWRILRIIIPENTDTEIFDPVFYELECYAYELEIEFEVIKFAIS